MSAWESVALTKIQGADLPGLATPCPMRAKTDLPMFGLSADRSAMLKNRTELCSVLVSRSTRLTSIASASPSDV